MSYIYISQITIIYIYIYIYGVMVLFSEMNTEIRVQMFKEAIFILHRSDTLQGIHPTSFLTAMSR